MLLRMEELEDVKKTAQRSPTAGRMMHAADEFTDWCSSEEKLEDAA